MSRDTEHDDLPEAVVAAIVAILARLAGEDDDEQEASAWVRAARVAPDWRGDGKWRR